MKPTQILAHEHEVILLVVEAAEREAAAIRNRGRVDAGRIAQIADFFAGFADTCHHAKEERLLFPLLEAHGKEPKECSPAELARQHETGRNHVRAIRAALVRVTNASSPAREVADHLAAYADLLREHIRKENEVLFPYAERILSRAEQDELAREFERIEREETGVGVHERYHRLAHNLAGRRAAA